MKPIYLVVTPFFPSPTRWQGAYVLDQVKAISRNSDYEVVVIRPQSSKFDTEEYEVDGIKVHRFSIISTPSYFFNGIFNKENSRRFMNFVKKLGIDSSRIKYVHTHTGPYAVYGLALKKMAPQAKVLVQHHDLDVFNVRNGKWAHWKPNALFRARNCQRLYKDVDLHICISTPVKDNLLAFPQARREEVYQSYLDALKPVANMQSIAPGNIYVLYNGVDTELFKPNEDFRYEENRKTFKIGCIANFNELKDHRSLVEAFKILVEKGYLDMRLSLLGTGEKRAETEDFLKKNNLYDFTEWPVEVTHDKLPQYYRSLDLFVLPSYFEGFGCVYTEAYACGVPFIGVYHQGAAECVAPKEQDKWLVQPKNPEQLAERIERYYNERDMQHLCQPYDINELIKPFLKYIESL